MMQVIERWSKHTQKLANLPFVKTANLHIDSLLLQVFSILDLWTFQLWTQQFWHDYWIFLPITWQVHFVDKQRVFFHQMNAENGLKFQDFILEKYWKCHAFNDWIKKKVMPLRILKPWTPYETFWTRKISRTHETICSRQFENEKFTKIPRFSNKFYQLTCPGRRNDHYTAGLHNSNHHRIVDCHCIVHCRSYSKKFR